MTARNNLKPLEEDCVCLSMTVGQPILWYVEPTVQPITNYYLSHSDHTICLESSDKSLLFWSYVPGPNFSLAAENIVASYQMALRNSADDPVFLLGDFNNCEISVVLPNLEQYITCPTRLNKTLD